MTLEELRSCWSFPKNGPGDENSPFSCLFPEARLKSRNSRKILDSSLLCFHVRSEEGEKWNRDGSGSPLEPPKFNPVPKSLTENWENPKGKAEPPPSGFSLGTRIPWECGSQIQGCGWRGIPEILGWERILATESIFSLHFPSGIRSPRSLAAPMDPEFHLCLSFPGLENTAAPRIPGREGAESFQGLPTWCQPRECFIPDFTPSSPTWELRRIPRDALPGGRGWMGLGSGRESLCQAQGSRETRGMRKIQPGAGRGLLIPWPRVQSFSRGAGKGREALPNGFWD